MNPATGNISRKGAKTLRNRLFSPYAPSRLSAFARVSFLSGCLILLGGCATRPKYRIPRNQKPESVKMETTGYCRCGKCCGWKRNWKFKPVAAYGPTKGQPKAVGITATGTRADWGTIAADTRYYPFGTIMYVPDYGWGRVEDIGGAIKGKHIDLFFPTHRKALEWGREWKTVKIWKPKKRL